MFRILLELIIKNPPGGVYHWCGLEKLSKWDMCRIIGEELGLDTSHLQEVTGAGGTPRPRRMSIWTGPDLSNWASSFTQSSEMGLWKT